MSNLDKVMKKVLDIDIKSIQELDKEMNQKIKDTFDLLEFKTHPCGSGVRATYAVGDEDKGLIISVVGGDNFYGDGKESFEVGICLGGSVAVAGWKTKQEVADLIEMLSDFNR
jgi:hypothetical protein